MTSPTDTVQQLHELPDLAAECFATWGHPNPSERPVVAVKRIHPKAPADLDTLDALRADKLGLLHRLAQCVRAVVEDMHEHPGDITDTPTWASECDWLIAHANTWRADAFLADWIGSEVRSIHRELCRVARVHPPLKLQCPRCQAPIRLQDNNSYFRCDAGHLIEHRSEIERMGRLTSMTYEELELELRIPQGTLWRWKSEKLIYPDGKRSRMLTFNVEAVRRVAESVRKPAAGW